MKKWPLLVGAGALCAAFALHSTAQIAPTVNPLFDAPNDPPPLDGPIRRVRPPFEPPFAPPFPRPIPRPFPAALTELRLEKQSAKVEIRGPVATTHLRQTLRNSASRALEGTFLFALPDGAAVSNFAMTMGGKRLEAEVLDGDQARQIYANIVRQMRDPAILEFVGRGIARVKIFPIPPHQTAEIELDYTQNAAQGQLSIPLRSPQPRSAQEADSNGQNAAKSSVEIEIEGEDVRGVYSPSHRVETRRVGSGTNSKTLISGEFGDSNRDFSLLWTRDSQKVGLTLFSSKTAGEDGTFLLLAAPDAALSRAQIEAKDVVFVFDTSGSMEGAKIEQARRALQTLLGNLGPKDRFGIVTFASSAQTFRDALVEASPANLSDARRFAGQIRALGGTNIGEALQSAFKLSQKSARPQQIVFLTDGQPTVGQANIDALLEDAQKQNGSGARVFSFGLGNDVNARLLDALASDGRGAADYVAPGEDIEVKVGALYEKIAFPVLSGGEIDFGGLQTYDIYPPRLPDLFKGGQVAVMGRFRGDLPRSIALSGLTGGQKSRFQGQISRAATGDLTKLWATRKVGFLIEDARRAGLPLDGEVREEIVKLSRRYGIVTPLTAGLITEDSAPSSRFAASPAPMLRNRAGGRATRGFALPDDLAQVGDSVNGNFNANAGGFAPRLAESGAAGVATAQKARELREGRADVAQNVKIVAGKTFRLRDGVWTDAEFDAKKSGAVRAIKFASNEYFQLVKTRELAQFFSVGERVIVMWKGEALRVEPQSDTSEANP